MIQVIQLKGKDKQLYRLWAPLVMDPEVIRANNNYPFKTNDNFVWFVAFENREIIGFIPVEQKGGKRAVINNYYIAAEAKRRDEILCMLLPAIMKEFVSEGWMLNSVTLIQDKATFEKFEFAPVDMKWTRYVKMFR